MIQIQELLVLMQNQTQIRICESENLSLARAVYSAQITVPYRQRKGKQATQGEISNNSLISLKIVASGTLKHLRALGLAQATPMRAGAPTFRTPSLAAAAATQMLEHFAKCDQIDVGRDQSLLFVRRETNLVGERREQQI